MRPPDRRRKKRAEVIIIQHDAGPGSALSAGDEGFEVIIPEGTSSTFDNNTMDAENTVRCYSEDVWEEFVETVTFVEAVEMLGRHESR